MKKSYRTRSRKNGCIYTTFSTHAEKRLYDRNVNILELLSSLCQVSEELCQVSSVGKNIAVIAPTLQLAIILHISRCQNGLYYFNVITILGAEIMKRGEVIFYGVEKLVTV